MLLALHIKVLHLLFIEVSFVIACDCARRLNMHRRELDLLHQGNSSGACSLARVVAR